MLTIPKKAYRVADFIGEDFDATLYTRGAATHWVKIVEIDTGRVSVEKFSTKAKARDFAELQAKQ